MTPSDDPFAFLPEPVAPRSARALVPDFVQDELPSDTSDADLLNAYAYHLIWKFSQPKTLKTVRRYLLQHTEFLSALADSDPSVFDEVICAYAERALTFDQPHAGKPAPSVVTADQSHFQV